MSNETFEIFLACAPGLEPILRDEARALGFDKPACVPGGVTVQGGWRDVWRANLELRGAGRVSAGLGGFRAMHLAQLDKRARKFPWGDVLRHDVPVKVEATCRKSRIYHDKAAAQRIETALSEAAGIPVSKDAAITLRCRIEDDLCSFSIDTSGALLHKRGHKEAVGKAPMRETLASLFLRQCGYTGTEPVIDPMCGSGTFVIEAAEMALGLKPGRSRSFAFEQLVSFDAEAWEAMKATQPPRDCVFTFRGSDRDAGAVAMSRQNADRAGVSSVTEFAHHAVSDLQRPDGPPGLVIVNPPYGGRIGNKKLLYALHASLGQVMKERFAGWRMGIITNEAGLARATGLDLQTGPPVAHGGLKVRLFQARIPG
ncbi:class I SAM-dependent RNA methyltransferase [Primorskyibacter aestuariivivens]|uniref:THUMP domain-containing class I SAM-dependent RNA methyltransferase n=1 Tax=Primorskyibacter aestuariivivens TaxID=1888912 RepID=UPI0023007C9B|nr:class I SAM-dependent RNA methyltransferase [Primorskyibacter aestuariivivens]MDA7427863.1 class I SAM-dependent RNA methyltransferase [Primorskyibacter aestuariivivens]